MKKYFSHQIKKELIVQDLITIETLAVSSGFSYPEETHNFYEFAYIDAGTILCHTKSNTVALQQGEFYLIPPGLTHSYQAFLDQSAVLFIICFRSRSDYLSLLDHKISLDKDAKRIISEIIRESKKAFVFPFDKKIKLLDTPIFGAQQMVENNIEKLLIYLIRGQIRNNADIVFVMNSEELEHSLSSDIIKLLKNRINDTVSLDEISQLTFYSKTFLNDIFKKNTGMSIMKYYNMLKIQEAKKLLRKNIPIAVIANQLNFESATYFTKVFKKYTQMTPTAYKKTIL